MNYTIKIAPTNIHEICLEAYDSNRKEKLVTMKGNIYHGKGEIPKTFYDKFRSLIANKSNIYFITSIVFNPSVEEVVAKEVTSNLARTFEQNYIKSKKDIMIIKPTGFLDYVFYKMQGYKAKLISGEPYIFCKI